MIRLHEPTFGDEEIEAVAATMRSGRVTQGPKVEEFEAAFCEKFGYRHAVSCNSGSSANLLAILAAEEIDWLGGSDDILVPALCWATTVAPIIQIGHQPIIVDCNLDSLNFNFDSARESGLSYTDPCMLVHVYGNPCLRPEASRPYALIEDCCEALGASGQGKSSIGSFATAATFSFYYSHHITTIEGGMVVTDSAELADIMRSLRSHGWTRGTSGARSWPEPPSHVDPNFWFPLAGYNLRMTEPQAAMGLVQLPKLDGFITHRRWAHESLRVRLEDVPGLILQDETPGAKASWFGFTIISPKKREIIAALTEAGVETRPIIAGNIAEHPMLLRYPHRIVGELPNARRVMREGFAIPCHHALTEADIDLMADTIRKAV